MTPRTQRNLPRAKSAASVRTLGLGLITGAADDDPSAIGTYASAGAAIGPAFLWTAPVTFPMMCAVVYLSAKLGQVSGKGLFHIIKNHYSRWILLASYSDRRAHRKHHRGRRRHRRHGRGACAARAVAVAPHYRSRDGCDFCAASVGLVRAYSKRVPLARVESAGVRRRHEIIAKPDLLEVIKGTLIPTIRFDAQFLSLLVAVIGTTLSAYLYTWQSNQEVEEEIAMGRRRLVQRQGATKKELKAARN